MKSRSSSISFVPPGRRGFTLIELLVVIGIILILMGLFFAGGKIISGQAKERDTRTMLETCKTMFENYRNATHLSRPPPAGASGTLLTPSNVADGYPAVDFWTFGQEIAPGVLSTDPSAYAASVSGMPHELIDTALVMYALKSVPENATILNNIPPAKILNATIQVTVSGSPQTVSVPLLLDGWGNPILFVPGGGLTGVWIDGVNQEIVTSAGVQLFTYDPGKAVGTIIPNQPFFVSAGPDGDFSNAHGWTSGTPNSNQTDDNVYSFK